MARRRSAQGAPRGRPTLLALLADCKVHGDDGRRLILADWLEEHGDEADRARADHIRLQVEMGRLAGEEPGWLQLFRRAGRLREGHQKAWLGALSALCEPGHAELHRGLVTLRVDAPAFLAPAAAALAGSEAYAWVEGLRFTAVEAAEVRPVLASPLMEGVTHLQLGGAGLAGPGLQPLVRSPRLAQLASLDLSGQPLGDAGAVALAACPRLGALGELILAGCELSGEALACLASSPHLDGLWHLSVAHNPLGLIGGLVPSARLPRLRWLEAQQTTLYADEARELVGALRPGGVERLNLSENPLGPEGVEAVAASPLAEGLVSLGLSDVAAGEGVLALGAARLPALRSLSLAVNRVDGAGLEALAANPTLAGLVNLDLRDNPLRARGAAALAASPWRLMRLNLDGAELRSVGAARLARWPGLAALRVLRLRNNAIGPRGARALAASPTMGELTTLDLDNNGLDDAAVAALAEAPWLGRVVWLSLRYNQIGERGVAALVASPHLGDVQALHLFSPRNTYGAGARAALQDRFGKALAMY